jgi:REP element-mobilizing transposase RayT
VAVTAWAAFWKGQVSRALKGHGSIAIARELVIQTLWQRDCWDTQIRDSKHFQEKWDYVIQNPVRKGLVASPEMWPFTGTINELMI